MKIIWLVLISMMIMGNCFAAIKWINGYSRSNGTYVSGHYRDTSNDGNPYNNANYLGYNRKTWNVNSGM